MAEEENRKICIASGKGGVGKTVITSNLAIALGRTGVDTLVVDADLDMANLEMVLGKEGRPITLQDIIKGSAEPQDAIYELEDNVRFVPAGISPTQFRRMDPDKFKRIVDELSQKCDVLLMDAPAGVGKDTIACFNACDETILVITPESIATADASKTKNISEKMGSEITGVVVNRIQEKRYGMNDKEITSFLNASILANIKEDPKVRKSVSERKPMLNYYPKSQFSESIYDLAEKITGEAYTGEKKKVEKGGILAKIKGIFSR